MSDELGQIERINAITAEAVRIFDDAEKAQRWLHTNNLALRNTPFAMLATDEGANEVRKVLNAIAYGGVV
jgi:uncharacterized protein (DUF2384 family)